MDTPHDLACAVSAAMNLLTVSAFVCIVATAPARVFFGESMTLAWVGPIVSTSHSCGEIK